jgi:hypothetical protein
MQTINRNNFQLQLVKDHFIYEVFYMNKNIGYFHESRLEEAIQEITTNGFYDGKNYDLRIEEVNKQLNINLEETTLNSEEISTIYHYCYQLCKIEGIRKINSVEYYLVNSQYPESCNGLYDLWKESDLQRVKESQDKWIKAEERRKQFVIDLLKDGYHSEIKTFSNMFNKRAKSPTTTDYCLIHPTNNTFYTVTKTEYNFFNYLKQNSIIAA